MNISDSDIKRIADLKVIAAMQPIKDKFMELYVTPLLGKQRVENKYPIGSLNLHKRKQKAL